jgi:tRNA threonylcarbamoyl adenosine modification protein YjeE
MTVIPLPDAAATAALAARLAPLLTVGDVLLIDGELGAGKTTFTRALVVALGGDPAPVASPTFGLMHRYAARLPVIHVDAWRLRRSAELDGFGFAEAAAEGVAVVEWAERVADAFGDEAWRLRLAHDGHGGRTAQVAPPPAAAAAWLQVAGGGPSIGAL